MSNARNISKADSRFVNATGDTISGAVTVDGGGTGSGDFIVRSNTNASNGSAMTMYRKAADKQAYMSIESDQLYFGVPATDNSFADVGTKGGVDLRLATAYSPRLTIKADGTVEINKGTNSLSAFPSGNWAAKIYNQVDTADQGGLVVGNRYQHHASTPFLVGGLYDAGNGFDTYLKVNGVGHITTPLQPAFNATATAGTVHGTAWRKIDYAQSVSQRGGNYNASTYRFTAPITGWYQFNASWSAENNSDTDGTFVFAINGNANANKGTVSMPDTGSLYEGHVISACMYLAENDYVEVMRYSTVQTQTRGYNWTGNFSGYLIG